MQQNLPKLDPRWKGPFRIKHMNDNNRSAVIESIVTNQEIGKYHLNHLRPFRARDPDNNDVDPRGWEELARLSESADEQLSQERQWERVKGDPLATAHFCHYYHICHSTAVTSLLLSLLTAVTASMRKQAGTARREIIDWGFPSAIFGVTITTHSN